MSINYVLAIKREQFKNSKRDPSVEAFSCCIPCSETEECLGLRSFIRELPINIFQSEEDELKIVKKEDRPYDCFMYELERDGNIVVLETGRPLTLQANDIVRFMFAKNDPELYVANPPFFLTIQKALFCKADLYFHIEGINRTFGNQDFSAPAVQNHLSQLAAMIESRPDITERDLNALLPQSGSSNANTPRAQIPQRSIAGRGVMPQRGAQSPRSSVSPVAQERPSRRFEAWDDASAAAQDPIPVAPVPTAPPAAPQPSRRQEVVENFNEPAPPAGDGDLWANDSWDDPWSK